MSESPYLSSGDSALLRRALTGYSGGTCVEIGAGNGGNLAELSKRFALVVGTDLVRPSMSDWRGGANFVLADRATCVRDSSSDLVAFNPPYLAENVTEDLAVEGGSDLEVPKGFLRDALRAVRGTGAVVFLLNDTAEVKEFESICAGRGFGIRRIASLRVFFEELAVYEAAAPEKGGR